MILAVLVTVAGAIPLGMLAIRTLAHHAQPLASAPMSASRPSAPARPPAAAAPTFSAVAGPGCPPVTSATTYPYQAPDGDGWHTGLASTSGPCGSSYLYSYLAMVPGNPGEWHDHYSWTFRTGMTSPSCTLSFYIPASPQTNSVAYYWFSAGSANAVNRIADFTIDQATHQGQWVSHGPFTFPGGTVLAEVTDRGEAPSPASAVAGPVRLTC
jgi:translation initiation factor IF-2